MMSSDREPLVNPEAPGAFFSGSELAEAREWRRHLHAHPETAYDEHATAAFVADRLREFGLTPVVGIGGTGLAVELDHGRVGAARMLRADLDGLPIQEANTFAHASCHPARMHACGHDGHVVMLLLACRAMARRRQNIGRIVALFQPAEEGVSGANACIQAGLFEQFPVRSVYGMHNWPGLTTGTFAVRDGAVMASSDHFEIQLVGTGAHAAMPHLSADTLLAGAQIVVGLQALVSRQVDPLEPAVVSVTQFNAGETWNVIPDKAVLRGTIRALSPAVRLQLGQAVKRVACSIAAAFGVSAEVEVAHGNPVTINTRREAEECLKVATALVGPERVELQRPPTMGAEDFAHYLERYPGCYVFLGSGETATPLHHPNYDFPDELLAIGASYWVSLAESSPAD